MKRKYLSALLMGTLTVASMSTFTSCKDYDDDISNLQGQIDKLASADELKQKVSELQALISANQSGISSLQAELAKKTTLDEVKAVLANYATNENVTKEANEIVNAAIKALQDKDIAELKTAIEAAQKTADQAVKDAADAKAEILKTLEDYALKSDVEAVRDAANTAIAAVKSENTQAINAAKTEILEKLQDYATKEALNGVAEAAKAAVEAAKADNATKLAEAKTALEAKITAAQNTADEAKTKAAENAAAILALANTTTTANNALAQANANKTAIENALKTLGTGFSEQNTVAAAIEAINGQLTAKNTGLSGLDGRLSAIEVALRNNESESVPALNVKVNAIQDKLKDIIGQYSTMVTDVQLYNFAPGTNQYGTATFNNRTLKFIQAEEQDNVFPADAKAADKQLTFKKGKYYAGEDSLLIRVSPVDAELTASNISLMNSQGKELNDIIDVTDVHRYKGLISRAEANTGLWVVKFKATDLGDNFKEAAMVDPKNEDSQKILYAVAVKNSYNTTDKAEDAKTRRVTSEFGVDLNTGNADHAWDFKVKDQSVANIHNRYVKTESYEYTDMKSGYYAKTYAEELVWKGNPATTVVKENADANKINAVDRKNHTYDNGWGDWYDGIDNRQSKAILAVEKGKPITIDFSNTELKGVKGFYVTLDEKFAKESAPSELNAWNSYEYENVGYKGKPAKLFEGSTGTITIKDMNNVQGDIIGFRVYAVNYDGTLYDPDGRAFYVAVGDVKKELSLGNSKLTVNASNKFESTVVLPADFSKYDFNGNTGWKVTEEDADGKKPTDFTVKYYNAEGEEIALSKDVRSIKFILYNPQAFIDGATYNVSMTLTNTISSATANVCTVNASFTKVMPTAAPTFCYREGFTKNPEFIIPANNSYEVLDNGNKGGSFNFRHMLIIDNNNEWVDEDLMDATSNGKFKFNVVNGTYENDKLAKAETSTVSYILNVNNSGATNLVDNTTERTIAANYIYKNISKDKDDEGNYVAKSEFPVPSKSTEKIVYCSWMKEFDVDTTTKNTADKKSNTWTEEAKVEWNATASATGTTLHFDQLAVKMPNLNLLPVTKGVNGKTLDTFFASKVLKIVDSQYGAVYTTSKDGTQINPYFAATIGDNGVTLTQKSQQAIPSSVKEGKIVFTVKDCFGNTQTFKLPFAIKVNAVPAAAKKH